MGQATDILYPQYEIRVKWTNRGQPNGTQLHQMYRDDPGVEAVESWARNEWWPEYERRGEDAEDLGIEVIALPPESWIVGWFNHRTFDVGQSDDEALASFERFVRRYESMQDYPVAHGPPEGYRCLMGAEDRWRWHGEADGDARHPAPCRCEFCVRDGFIRVNH